MGLTESLHILGISAGLGLLVGLQRERSGSATAGFRTFMLITVFGTVCGLLARDLGGWIVAAGLAAVCAATVMGNVAKLRRGDIDPGITTEIACLLMFAIGAYLAFGHKGVAIVAGGAVAVFLHAKPILHGLAQRMGDNDMRAIMQFALITLVILPVLPNRTFGPLSVLNPFDIWRMVVLVVGISLAGYVALKFAGDRAGAILGGVLGGMVSSTATTVSYARRASTAHGHVAAATLVIGLASAVVYCRVLIEIGAVARSEFGSIAPPIIILLTVAIFACLALWLMTGHQAEVIPPSSNPAELKTALIFGAMYAVVLLGAAAAERYFSDRGLYVVAAISGLTDMDAITLSTSRLAASGTVAVDTAWRAIIVAAISNLMFKASIVAMLGGRRLLGRVAIVFAVQTAAALALLLLWPGGRWFGPEHPPAQQVRYDLGLLAEALACFVLRCWP